MMERMLDGRWLAYEPHQMVGFLTSILLNSVVTQDFLGIAAPKQFKKAVRPDSPGVPCQAPICEQGDVSAMEIKWIAARRMPQQPRGITSKSEKGLRSRIRR